MSKTADRRSRRAEQRTKKAENSPPPAKKALSAQTIFYAGIGWCVVALLYFLLFSVRVPGEDVPLWYSIGTYILELGAFFSAALFCYRNWKSPQIASGRNVWLGIGLGMLSYFIGSCVYGVWELYFKLEPDVSPADFFYAASYVSLGWGMILAVIPRRLNLELRQWLVVGGMALVGIILALLVAFVNPAEEADATPPAAETHAATLATPAKDTPASKTAQHAPALKAEAKPEAEPSEIEGPEWLKATDKFLSQFSFPVNLFYVIADVGLLIIATILLLAFWGGRFSQSWRMIAAATFCLYIADMWEKHAYTFIPNYESGNLLEVFFVFSGVLFGLGAALEYDVSTSRHKRGRRRQGG